METTKINLFVFDTKDNFEKSKKFLGEEVTTFKRIICVENASEFELKFKEIPFDEHVFLVVHVFYTDDISGIKSFLASRLSKKYVKLGYMYISDGDSKKINHDMVDAQIPNSEIYKYHQVQSNLEEEKITVYTKKQILEYSSNAVSVPTSNDKYPKIDYAIITALYNDEFEELKRVFDFPSEEIIKTSKKHYHIGYLKSDKNYKIVAAIPNATGMVDSSIIATQMLELFRPKYLLMSGVCGGSSDYSFGDIIIAKQVYTFQKGKISDIIKKDGNDTSHVDLFDKDRNVVDYNHLFDKDGNQIAISIEKFEREHDAVINIDSALEDAITPHLKTIESKINESIKTESFLNEKVIKIVVEPIACSTMVINKEGYFDDTIRSINRKIAAVEMESYGVARACQFANEGNTIPLIFKSVMDNTSNKSDYVDGINYKKFAAYTSAQFMKCLFENKIL